MINKDQVIKLAFLELGEQNYLYNQNIADKRDVAETLLDSVIESLAIDSNFLFNARTVFLNHNVNPKNKRGEYRYNLPNDFLNVVRYSDKNARLENEFIYSKDDELEMTYCFHLGISEIPKRIEPLITISLAIRLAKAYRVYESQLPRLANDRMQEIDKIYVGEGLPFKEDIDVDWDFTK